MCDSGLPIADFPHCADAPRPDRVVVVEVVDATNCEQFAERRLDIVRLVDGTALDDDFLSAPLPRHPKAGQRPRQHRLLQLGRFPVPAGVDGNLDALDLAVPAPGEAGDFVGPLSNCPPEGRVMIDFASM